MWRSLLHEGRSYSSCTRRVVAHAAGFLTVEYRPDTVAHSDVRSSLAGKIVDSTGLDRRLSVTREEGTRVA